MRAPLNYGFLLIPGFPLMSYAAAIEPLRAANLLSGEKLYSWRHLTIEPGSVQASNQVEIVGDDVIGGSVDCDAIFVCAGGNPAQFKDAKTLAWLRALSRRGLTIAGMSGGSYVLARAGLLKGYRATIHWEHIPALEEDFPELDIRRTLFEIDRGRVTCAGGIASLDMMLALIEQSHGPALAADISDWFLRTQPREGNVHQRLTAGDRYRVNNPQLLKALHLMEQNLERPLGMVELSTRVGVSTRQIERLFSQWMRTKPQRHYLQMRTEHAQRLLRQTSMMVTEVAVACGFASASHFSRAYKSYFGHAPLVERQIRNRPATNRSNSQER
jgi:transcriptional regulator GlxA family with amidase domain